jgi:hypothetical protein
MIYPIAHGLPTPAHGHDCALFSIHRLLLLTQPQPLHIDLQRSGGWRSRIKAITCICNIRALLWIRLTSNIVRRVVSPYGGVLVTMSKVSYANIIVNTRRNTAKTRYRKSGGCVVHFHVTALLPPRQDHSQHQHLPVIRYHLDHIAVVSATMPRLSKHLLHQPSIFLSSREILPVSPDPKQTRP